MIRFLLLGLWLLFSGAAVAETKRAFIVGVGDYDETANASGIEDLKKTVNDARAYAEQFRSLGWSVEERFLLLNPTLAEFDTALDAFVAETNPGDEIAFVYSGHGWSFGRENFITFTDTVFDPNGTGTNETSFGIGGQVLPRLALRSRIAQQRPRIVLAIIDACREAPFGEGGATGLMNLGGGGTMGMRPIKGPRGSMVIYSAGEGEFASETLGPGDDDPNSAFSRFMLDALKDADRPLKDVFDDVRRDVFYEARKFSRTQTPAIYDAFLDDYCLSGTCREGDEEASDLQGVKDCASARAFNAKWPNGRLSALGQRLQASYCTVPETRPEPAAGTSTEVDELDLLLELGKPSGSTSPTNVPNTATFTKGATVAWERTSGGKNVDSAGTVQPTADGGVISIGGDGTKLFAMKFNSDGGIIWKRDYPRSEIGRLSSILGATSSAVNQDNEILLVGSASFEPPNDGSYLTFSLSKIDFQGKPLWHRAFYRKDSSANVVLATSDKGILIAGRTRNLNNSSSDILLMRLDKNGDELWSQAFGTESDDTAYAAISTLDGGAIIVGSIDHVQPRFRTPYLPDPDKDNSLQAGNAFALRIDRYGQQLWLRRFGDDGISGATTIEAASDGGALVGGWADRGNSEGTDAALWKIDSNGGVIWKRIYNGSRNEKIIDTIDVGSDGSLILASENKKDDEKEEDILIFRIDSLGNLIWRKTIGGKGRDFANDMTMTRDGSVILAGHTEFQGENWWDAYVIKLDPVD